MADVPPLARDVVGLLEDVLGDELLGACLHGSAVLGGLRPGSDVDVLAVARRSLVAEARRALLDGLLDVSGARAHVRPGRPVELTVVVQQDVRPWRYPPAADFQYGEWLRQEYERGMVPAPRLDPDLALLLTVAVDADAALVGPPPSALLDAVPRDDVRRSMADTLPGLLADLHDDTANVLLTLARMETTLATGRVVPKDVAAGLVAPLLDAGPRAALERARRVYLGADVDQWDDLRPQVAAFAAHAASVLPAALTRS